jgi:archaellum biogenesis ATPase FlaH
VQRYSKILTGFSFLDQKWGGVYPGGNYFIFGSKKSGKTILALNIIDKLVQNDNSVLLITSERNKNLEIQASSIYFDISEAIDSELLKIEKISDDLNSLEKIKELIPNHNISFLFIDEILHEQLVSIKDDYLAFLELLEDSNITSFFIASVPQNEILKTMARKIANHSTAVIQLQKRSTRNYSGIITLKPNIAHFEGEFETSFKVEPIKGFITLADNESAILNMLSKDGSSEILRRKLDFKYSNIYSVEEFQFLIDTKVALAKSTEEKINFINYEQLKNKDIVELFNAIRIKLTPKDKTCFTNKNLYILPEKRDRKDVQKLSEELDKIAENLFDNPDDLKINFNKRILLLNQNIKII